MQEKSWEGEERRIEFLLFLLLIALLMISKKDFYLCSESFY